MFDANAKLQELLQATTEKEVLEFKQAKTQFSNDKLGEYFSALSNEANLKNQQSAWLLLGVDNDRNVVGTRAYPTEAELGNIKKLIADQMTARLTFIEIHEVEHLRGRVLLMEIPPAPQGMPIAYQGHYYGRDGSSLGALNLEEIDRIRAQQSDWSMLTINDATIDDLDPRAIKLAREKFLSKHPEYQEEMADWDDVTFLNKAKITIKGKITNTAIVLLGKRESEYLISPASSQVTWILKDKDGIEKDYQIFTCPLLLAIDEIYAKVRNLKYRYIQEGTLFPEEVDQYDPYLIRESLNNAIAHKDYRMGGRVTLVEFEDGKLVIKNKGSFIPKSIEAVIQQDSPEDRYRNKYLADAMFSLKLIDTMGSGIKKMFNTQRRKFFPLPDYEIQDNDVQVTIYGKVIDMNYTQKLAEVSDLSLGEVIMLDKIQKSKPLNKDEIKHLKARKLIEGRGKNYFIAKHIAQKSDDTERYIKDKGFDDSYYKDMILRYLEEFDSAKRASFDKLLFDKLPAILTEEQKGNKVRNFLQALRTQGKISINGKEWRLAKN